MKRIHSIFFFSLLVLLNASDLKAQLCDSTQLILSKVRANQTDGNIPWELAQHHIFYNPTCTHKGKLLIYLVGSYDNPTSTTYFPALAANYGYHVLSLNYSNSVAAQQACASSTDPDCFLKFRKEVIYGTDLSTEVQVDSTNSIVNRMVKLLEYLQLNHSGENWGQFLINGAPNWSKLTVAGHSQGGGHAAVLGLEQQLDGVIMFSSPNDYSSYFSAPAAWCSGPFATPDSNFYGLNNLQDEVVSFSDQHAVWQAMPFSQGQDTVLVTGNVNPFQNSHLLYIDHVGSGELSENHNATVRDSHTPISGSEKPMFTDAWLYMLGHRESPLSYFPGKDAKHPAVKTLAGGFLALNDLETVELFDLRGRTIWRIFDVQNGEMVAYPDLVKGTVIVKVVTVDQKVSSFKYHR